MDIISETTQKREAQSSRNHRSISPDTPSDSRSSLSYSHVDTTDRGVGPRTPNYHSCKHHISTSLILKYELCTGCHAKWKILRFEPT